MGMGMSDPKKHTPGPWQVYEPSAMDHSGWEVFQCIDGTRIAMVRLEGDCRLIASAPEMKARIEQLEAALQEWARCRGAVEQHTGPRGILPGDADLYAAEKALRKLIGEA